MQWSDVSFRPPTQTLRQFAVLWLIFFGGLAGWQGYVRSNPGLAAVLGALAVVVGGLGILWPSAVRWLYVGWMVAAFPIGWTISQLILICLYLGLFTPVALVFRILGRDALSRRFLHGPATYWAAKPAVTDPKRYFQQF
jgi:Saxitoxin biosynthesis operon protein SxtJ